MLEIIRERKNGEYGESILSKYFLGNNALDQKRVYVILC